MKIAPEQRTIKSGSYVFPMKSEERECLLYSMTPCARAWFYEREMKALKELEQLTTAKPD